ncbi:MAG: hypothetical protein NVV73_15450 [Cellvibrionaceae bacterium]|nr:hypothetical protein [Cellvibrionaceae bacterium]
MKLKPVLRPLFAGAAPALRLAFAGWLALLTHSTLAGSLEQAKRIHDRIAGIPPSEATLLAMQASIDSSGNGVAAAEMAMDDDAFYRVTLKNWIAPWTNRDQTQFVPLNDYIATVMGLVRDERDFREVLFDDVIYTASGVSPAYSTSSNAHYEALEIGSAGGVPYIYKDRLQRQLQSSVTGLPAEATAGVITTRAAAKAFFIAGTNRAQLRFTLMNHMCRDLEQVHDVTRIPDRIRQDVSRSPGGDARAFLNGCIGCHNGMDPLAQAFAYYDFEYNPEADLTGEAGRIVYNRAGDIDPDTGTRVKKKYHINSTTFPYGYVTPDDRWDNYWRAGINAQLGWSASLPGSGNGAKSMGQELAYSRAFAECQVDKVFRAVCLRQPEDALDRAAVADMTQQFAADNYRLKTVFAAAADYCKGE